MEHPDVVYAGEAADFHSAGLLHKCNFKVGYQMGQQHVMYSVPRFLLVGMRLQAVCEICNHLGTGAKNVNPGRPKVDSRGVYYISWERFAGEHVPRLYS
jgi:hypothetical protein